jgi:uncharacterized membrane protein YgdD (TMEM256/DUF423 family)
MFRWSYALIICAGLIGAAGVMEAAAAAHKVADPRLTTAANFLMLNATATLAMVAVARGMTRGSGWFLTAAAILVAGSLLFCGDLSLRAFAGSKLFPFAAPLGGSLMILSWIVTALSGIACGRSEPPAK